MSASARGKASRNRGALWERSLCQHLQANGYPEAQRELERRSDIGDVQGGPGGLLIEAKNEAKIDLPRYLRQASEAAEQLSLLPVVVVKRRSSSTGKSYVVMELDDFLELIHLPHEGGPRR